MAKIILLNGPPKVGKDSIARVLRDLYGYVHIKMADPLKAAAENLLLTEHTFPSIEDTKEIEIKPGYTVRKFLIDLSEEFIKPKLGENHFGKKAKEAIALIGADKYVISDCGFLPEIASLQCYELYLVRLFRMGTSFENDSRGYLEAPSLPVLNLEVITQTTLNVDLGAVKSILKFAGESVQ